jgi:CelD/BcsL family acetyltransferase involved in cellulose biosynthesis
MLSTLGASRDLCSDIYFSKRSQKIRTVTAQDFDSLASHMPAWDRLAWESPQRVWTLLPAWVDVVLRHKLKRSESWFCSFAYADDRLVGALPVIVAPHRLLGRRWPQLRPICDDIALAPDCATEAFESLLVEVNHKIPNHRGLYLRDIRHNSPVWRALRKRVQGYIVHLGPCNRYWCLNVEGDSNRYWAGLSKMRQGLRRGRRKLEKHGAVSVEMRKGPSAGEDFLAEFLTLEASGWKGRMGTAILNNPSDVALFTTLVRNLASQDRLEWHGIRIEGRLVAGQLGIRCGEALILHKYAYDEEFADCSPGHLLTEEVIKDSFSRCDISELSPMSHARQCCLWHMEPDNYTDVHLVRLNTLSFLFHFPAVKVAVAYHKHVLPRVPVAVKAAYQRLKRREYRKLFRPMLAWLSLV